VITLEGGSFTVKKAFLGLFKSVHILRVITFKGCSLREVLLNNVQDQSPSNKKNQESTVDQLEHDAHTDNNTKG
jgi:hypothetical protein